MRRVMVIGVLFATSMLAGPVKVASYPVRHPVKTAKAVVVTVPVALFKAAKAVLY